MSLEVFASRAIFDSRPPRVVRLCDILEYFLRREDMSGFWGLLPRQKILVGYAIVTGKWWVIFSIVRYGHEHVGDGVL